MQVFFMAVDIAPFDDPRVRQAFRLIPDRQALINGALAGFGTVGERPRRQRASRTSRSCLRAEQDLEQAKSLLKEAGQEDLTVTLHTSDIVPGFVESATLFAEQAKGAGVTVNIKKEPANAYFDTSLLYTKLDFAPVVLDDSPRSATWYTQALLSDAVWNETHWRDPPYDKLIQDAIGAHGRADGAASSGRRCSRSSTTRAATSSGRT